MVLGGCFSFSITDYINYALVSSNYQMVFVKYRHDIKDLASQKSLSGADAGHINENLNQHISKKIALKMVSTWVTPKKARVCLFGSRIQVNKHLSSIIQQLYQPICDKEWDVLPAKYTRSVNEYNKKKEKTRILVPDVDLGNGP